MRSGCREGPQSLPMPVVPWAERDDWPTIFRWGSAGNEKRPGHLASPAVHARHRGVNGAPRLAENGVTVLQRRVVVGLLVHDMASALPHIGGDVGQRHHNGRCGRGRRQPRRPGRGRGQGQQQKEQSCERQPPTPLGEPNQCCAHARTSTTTRRMMHLFDRRRTDRWVADDSRYGQSEVGSTCHRPSAVAGFLDRCARTGTRHSPRTVGSPG